MKQNFRLFPLSGSALLLLCCIAACNMDRPVEQSQVIPPPAITPSAALRYPPPVPPSYQAPAEPSRQSQPLQWAPPARQPSPAAALRPTATDERPQVLACLQRLAAIESQRRQSIASETSQLQSISRAIQNRNQNVNPDQIRLFFQQCEGTWQGFQGEVSATPAPVSCQSLQRQYLSAVSAVAQFYDPLARSGEMDDNATRTLQATEQQSINASGAALSSVCEQFSIRPFFSIRGQAITGSADSPGTLIGP